MENLMELVKYSLAAVFLTLFWGLLGRACSLKKNIKIKEEQRISGLSYVSHSEGKIVLLGAVEIHSRKNSVEKQDPTLHR